MKRSNGTEQRFHSMSEVERRYFPRSTQIVKERQERDAKTMGVIMARSSLAKVKTLLSNKIDIG